MMRASFLRGMLACVFLLGVVLSGSGQDADPFQPDRAKQIADLEKQIKDLQAKLKALKEPGPIQLASNVAQRWTSRLCPRTGPSSSTGARSARPTWAAASPPSPSSRPTRPPTASPPPRAGCSRPTNNGITFEHQFDKEATVSIGDVAVAPSNRNIVWVGTGEDNPRNSVSYGDGVYKSTDGGKTWKNMGLKKSFQIGKIVIHPKNPNIVYVGALGRLYGPSEERGLYKTTDGGKTWEKSPATSTTRPASSTSPCTRPIPETLIVATWERQRDEFDSFRGDAKRPPAADGYDPVKVHGPGTRPLQDHRRRQDLEEARPRACPRPRWAASASTGTARTRTSSSPSSTPRRPAWARRPARRYLGVATARHAARACASADVRRRTARPPRPACKKDDVLVGVDGKDLKTTDAADRRCCSRASPATRSSVIAARIERQARTRDIEVTLGTRPAAEAPPGAPRVSLGVAGRGRRGRRRRRHRDRREGRGRQGRAEGRRRHRGHRRRQARHHARACIFKLLADKKPGDKVKLTFQRGKEKKDVEVTLEPRTTGHAPAGPTPAGSAGQARQRPGPARAGRRRDRRRLQVDRRRRDLDAHQQPQPAAVVLLRRPRRSDRRQDRLRPRRRPLAQHRRRQDVQRRGQQHGRPRRPARPVDQPEGRPAHDRRHRRRLLRHLRPRRPLGPPQPRRARPVLPRRRGQPPAVPRLRRPAGQRHLGRPRRRRCGRSGPINEDWRLRRRRRRLRLPRRSRPIPTSSTPRARTAT